MHFLVAANSTEIDLEGLRYDAPSSQHSDTEEEEDPPARSKQHYGRHAHRNRRIVEPDLGGSGDDASRAGFESQSHASEARLLQDQNDSPDEHDHEQTPPPPPSSARQRRTINQDVASEQNGLQRNPLAATTRTNGPRAMDEEKDSKIIST
jgi:hypothetical protein